VQERWVDAFDNAGDVKDDRAGLRLDAVHGNASTASDSAAGACTAFNPLRNGSGSLTALAQLE